MILCQVRCASLDSECQIIAWLFEDMNIRKTKKMKIGVSYDDYTVGFYKNNSEVITEDDCK